MQGLFHGHGAHEIGRLHDRGVGAIDLQEFGGGVDAGEFEDVAEARAGPLGVAHGAAAPLNAGQFRSEEGASVAGAFEGRRDGVLRQLLEVGEGHLERLGDQAGEVEAVGGGIDRGGAGKVLANEEGVDGGDPGVEVLEGSFQILRTVVVEDHGPLAGDGGAVRAFELGGGGRGQKVRRFDAGWVASLIQPNLPGTACASLASFSA